MLMTRSRYENNHNFQVYGHQKFKTGAIRSFNNVIAYASDFGGKWPTPGTLPDDPNAMWSNRVWFQDKGQYHGTQGWTGKRAYDNHLVGLNVTLADGEAPTLAEWQAKNPSKNDVGSTYSDVDIRTQAAQIMEAAKDVLAPVLGQPPAAGRT